MGQIQDHTALLAPSFLGADPWSILYEPCPDVKQLSPGSSLEWTWDQSLLTVEIKHYNKGKRNTQWLTM
jgi:hypothetical protein